ncbi:MAG: adenosine deaminase [Bacilli bacterium]|nr:adenosine deaminase [Bacilli bacterium]
MLLEDLPKIELHVHLDGSVRVSTLKEFIKDHDNIEDAVMVAEDCHSLNEYLEKFELPLKVMQKDFILQRIGKELAEDLKKDKVLYAEVRFAPSFHTKEGLSMEPAVKSVLKGFAEVDGIQIRLLLCMMRGASTEENDAVIDLAYSYLGKGVVGIDLAGAEALYPTSLYKDLFIKAKKLGIPFTIHAGEADGSKSVEDAVSFGATRIGHGIRSRESNKTMQLLLDKSIHLEVCPTSNVQTKAVISYKSHPIKFFYDTGIKVSIHTDNRTVSNITLTREYIKLQKHFDFQRKDFIKMNIDAIKACFLNKEEKELLLRQYKEACMLTNESE